MRNMNTGKFSPKLSYKAETHTELTVFSNQKHAKNLQGQIGWAIQTGSEKGVSMGLSLI